MSSRDLVNVPMLALTAAAVFAATPSHAYIGPGAGLGAIAVTVALVLGVILLLFGLVWYPLKRMLRKKKSKSVSEDTPK